MKNGTFSIRSNIEFLIPAIILIPLGLGGLIEGIRNIGDPWFWRFWGFLGVLFIVLPMGILILGIILLALTFYYTRDRLITKNKKAAGRYLAKGKYYHAGRCYLRVAKQYEKLYSKINAKTYYQKAMELQEIPRIRIESIDKLIFYLKDREKILQIWAYGGTKRFKALTNKRFLVFTSR